jgi:hypothetical protein
MKLFLKLLVMMYKVINKNYINNLFIQARLLYLVHAVR